MMITSQSFRMDKSIEHNFDNMLSPTSKVYKAGAGFPSHDNSLMQSSRYSVDQDVFLPVEIDLLNSWDKNLPKENMDMTTFSGRLKTQQNLRMRMRDDDLQDDSIVSPDPSPKGGANVKMSQNYFE